MKHADLCSRLGCGRAPRGWCVVVMFAALSLFSASPAARAADDGGQPGAMLDWGVGARPVAMGGAFTAVAEGPTGFWWNPAGIAQMRDDAFEAAFRRMSFDRQAGYVTFLHPLGKEEAAICLSWIYAGVGNVFSYDVDGVRGDRIPDYSNAFAFSFARRFTDRTLPLGLALGLNLRYVQHNVANINAYTVGFDVGLHGRYRLPRRVDRPNDSPPEFRFGLAVLRLNQKYPWATSKYWVQQGETHGSNFDERFPVVVRVGGSALLLRGRALVAADLDISSKQGTGWHVGVEGRVNPLLALRGGLDNGRLTAGAGFTPQLRSRVHLGLDYAYAVQRDAIDGEHIFSLSVRF